jgi:hypothetical protein
MSYHQQHNTLEAAATQWLSDHKSDLSDVACPQQSYAEQKGFEIVGQVISDIAEEELAQGYWEADTEHTYLEACGQFNVAPLTCWNGKQDSDSTGAPIGTRFLPAKHIKKDKLASKARARFGIEFCYDKAGRVIAKGRSDAAIKQVAITRVKGKLSRLDRRMAAVAARKALKA